MAKKLTQRDSSGKLKVVGFNPFPSWYENVPAHFGPSWGANWVDSDGNSNLNTPAWADQLRWQKSLIDWYGYDNLVRCQRGRRRRVLGLERLRDAARSPCTWTASGASPS